MKRNITSNEILAMVEKLNRNGERVSIEHSIFRNFGVIIVREVYSSKDCDKLGGGFNFYETYYFNVEFDWQFSKTDVLNKVGAELIKQYPHVFGLYGGIKNKGTNRLYADIYTDTGVTRINTISRSADVVYKELGRNDVKCIIVHNLHNRIHSIKKWGVK